MKYDMHETLTITRINIWLRIFSSNCEHEYKLMVDVGRSGLGPMIKVLQGDSIYYNQGAFNWIQDNHDEIVLKVAFDELRTYIEDSCRADLDDLADAIGVVETWKGNQDDKKVKAQGILDEIEYMQKEINQKQWKAHRLLWEALQTCKDEAEGQSVREVIARLEKSSKV